MAKTGPKRKYEIEKSELQEMFQRMPAKAIAAHFGCGETLIWNRLEEYGISTKVKRKYKPRTEEHRRNLGISRRGKWGGAKAGNWRGGLAAANLRLRASGAYKQWKIESRKRAGNRCEGCGIANDTTCECCGTKIKLHCHHVKSFAAYPELRFDPKNSEVLCPKCHNSRHNGKIG